MTNDINLNYTEFIICTAVYKYKNLQLNLEAEKAPIKVEV